MSALWAYPLLINMPIGTRDCSIPPVIRSCDGRVDGSIDHHSCYARAKRTLFSQWTCGTTMSIINEWMNEWINQSINQPTHRRSQRGAMGAPAPPAEQASCPTAKTFNRFNLELLINETSNRRTYALGTGYFWISLLFATKCVLQYSVPSSKKTRVL